jgi:NAD(P)-dependent dehydrogenase (short-subunit alcohol dehydrogenase family)
MEKTVFISGVSRGIGFALAKKCLDKGDRVIGASRTGEVPALAHERFEAFRLDLADSQQIRQFKEMWEQRGTPLHILFNNAALGVDLGFPVPEEDTFRQTLEVNVTGTVFLTEALLPYLVQGGKIINISSKMGSIGLCGRTSSVAYRISKAALNMYSKVLANRLAGRQSVATLHPGWVRTTIADNNSTAPLSADESAEGILDFTLGDFDSGAYWDVEAREFLEW